MLTTPTRALPAFEVIIHGEPDWVPESEMIWIRNPNPLEPYGRGLGTASSLDNQISQHKAAQLWNLNFFRRSARPDVIVGVPDAEDDQLQRIREKWAQEHEGVEKAWAPAFLNSDFKTQILTNSIRDMDFVAGQKAIRDTVYQLYGVPPEILGVVENSNRATAEAATYVYSLLVLTPRLKRIRGALQRHLVSQFDDPLLALDFDSPVRETSEFLLKQASELFTRAVITRNEARVQVGYAPPDGRAGRRDPAARQRGSPGQGGQHRGDGPEPVPGQAPARRAEEGCMSMNVHHKQFPFCVRAIDDATGAVTAYASTINVDRYGEIVMPSAFEKTLASYLRTGTHLWAHDPSKMENLLGRAVGGTIDSLGLLMTFEYDLEEPEGAKAFHKIKKRILNSYSVGFYALAWTRAKDLDKYPDVKGELAGVDLTGVDVIFTEVELFEISLCAVPANRESLVVGRAMENTEKETTPVADPTLEKAAAPVRSKMDVIMRDAAARLRRLADSLECSEWYDSDEEDIAETRDGFVKVLEAVKADVLAELAEDLAEGPAEQPTLATEISAVAPEACAKAGTIISQARALSLEDEIEPEMDLSDIEV